MALDVSEQDRLAALGDLRELVRIAKQRGELEVIKGADTYLEMGALYELSLEHRFPPLLMFEDIKGHAASHRVLMNVRFSRLFAADLCARRAQGLPQDAQRGKPA